MKLVLSFLLCFTVVHANDAPVLLRSPETRVHLLELYTSEGCSSCPPAEEWLSGMGNTDGLWRDFVPVAFHVDYWDKLGWPDALASASFTRRQRVYASEWGTNSVYTPALVLNGHDWREWRGGLVAFKPSATKVGILEVTSADQSHWHVAYTPLRPNGKALQAHLAWLGSGILSEVKAGENTGHALLHDFTVLAEMQQPLVNRGSELSSDIAHSVTQRPAKARLAVAAWITADGSMTPMQAVGGWLSALP